MKEQINRDTRIERSNQELILTINSTELTLTDMRDDPFSANSNKQLESLVVLLFWSLDMEKLSQALHSRTSRLFFFPTFFMFSFSNIVKDWKEKASFSLSRFCSLGFGQRIEALYGQRERIA